MRTLSFLAVSYEYSHNIRTRQIPSSLLNRKINTLPLELWQTKYCYFNHTLVKIDRCWQQNWTRLHRLHTRNQRLNNLRQTFKTLQYSTRFLSKKSVLLLFSCFECVSNILLGSLILYSKKNTLCLTRFVYLPWRRGKRQNVLEP